MTAGAARKGETAMKYRLLFSDIDGTLRPNNLTHIPRANVEAIQAIQRHGVKFVIATGRGRAVIPEPMLNGLEPDYWVCAAGAQVLDQRGNVISSSRMRREELDALTAFCTENGYPLLLHFSDGPYACIGYDQIRQTAPALGLVRDGTERMRHLSEMPFSAAVLMPKEAEPRFQAKYGGLGLRFPYYSGTACDVLRPGQDKALGFQLLLEHLGAETAACVSVGDGNNDIGILEAAGLSFCVEDGAPDALAAADRVCPPSGDCGVAAVCRMVWPEAFDI